MPLIARTFAALALIVFLAAMVVIVKARRPSLFAAPPSTHVSSTHR